MIQLGKVTDLNSSKYKMFLNEYVIFANVLSNTSVDQMKSQASQPVMTYRISSISVQPFLFNIPYISGLFNACTSTNYYH